MAYDEICMFDRGQVTCAAGHDLAGVYLQTHDLGEPDHETYFVYGGELYAGRGYLPPSIERGARGLVVHQDRAVVPVPLTRGPVHASMTCRACAPVLCQWSASSVAKLLETMPEGSRPPRELEASYLARYEERISEEFPSVEYALFFETGKLTKLQRLEAETREALRERLGRSGGRAIGDTDPLAKQYFAQRARRSKG